MTIWVEGSPRLKFHSSTFLSGSGYFRIPLKNILSISIKALTGVLLLAESWADGHGIKVDCHLIVE
jgi:hypothetical protein